jgi:hypothetical protein
LDRADQQVLEDHADLVDPRVKDLAGHVDLEVLLYLVDLENLQDRLDQLDLEGLQHRLVLADRVDQLEQYLAVLVNLAVLEGRFR